MRAGTGRAVGFSDAVFAIVITLLILDLRVPAVPPGRLLRGLIEQWPAYLAYLSSYVYVAVVWLNHKAAFRRIRWTDRRVHWGNLLVLFTTALLPFPTAVLSHSVQSGNPTDERTAVALYALVGALLCLSWLRFYHHLGRRPELLEQDVDPGFFRRESLRAVAGVVAYLVAGAIGQAAIPAALLIFLIVPVFYGLTSDGYYELPAAIRRVSSQG